MDAIEKALSDHESEERMGGLFCRCGWSSEAWTHGETRADHVFHLAAEIRKALGESETEYGVRWPVAYQPAHPMIEATAHEADARTLVDRYPAWDGVVVSRTVTRSEWREVGDE